METSDISSIGVVTHDENIPTMIDNDNIIKLISNNDINDINININIDNNKNVKDYNNTYNNDENKGSHNIYYSPCKSAHAIMDDTTFNAIELSMLSYSLIFLLF
eukprot:GHVR01147448.1.p1 GENE.GHVR01147448.1~~GHVR01147448.1.p1  ORF type:complete len:104 (+),score=26.18 GHVR01147448.1:27-338(+)